MPEFRVLIYSRQGLPELSQTRDLIECLFLLSLAVYVSSLAMGVERILKLLWLTRLNILKGNSRLLGAYLNQITDIFMGRCHSL